MRRTSAVRSGGRRDRQRERESRARADGTALRLVAVAVRDDGGSYRSDSGAGSPNRGTRPGGDGQRRLARHVRRVEGEGGRLIPRTAGLPGTRPRANAGRPAFGVKVTACSHAPSYFPGDSGVGALPPSAGAVSSINDFDRGRQDRRRRGPCSAHRRPGAGAGATAGGPGAGPTAGGTVGGPAAAAGACRPVNTGRPSDGAQKLLPRAPRSASRRRSINHALRGLGRWGEVRVVAHLGGDFLPRHEQRIADAQRLEAGHLRQQPHRRLQRRILDLQTHRSLRLLVHSRIKDKVHGPLAPEPLQRRRELHPVQVHAHRLPHLALHGRVFRGDQHRVAEDGVAEAVGRQDRRGGRRGPSRP